MVKYEVGSTKGEVGSAKGEVGITNYGFGNTIVSTHSPWF